MVLKKYKNKYLKLVKPIFVILIIVLFFEFIIKTILVKSSPFLLDSIKNSTNYFIFNICLSFLFFVSYIGFSYRAIKNKIYFKNVFYVILRFSLFMFVLNLILITISYFWFIINFSEILNISYNGLYVLYLYLINLIKYTLLMIVMAISYILLKKLKIVNKK